MKEFPILGRTSFPSRRVEQNIAHISNEEVTTARIADETKFFDSNYIDQGSKSVHVMGVLLY